MIKCYVDSCDKEFKNKLAVSHHIKMSAINCLEHKKYLKELHQSIIKQFDNLDLSPINIGLNFNVGQNCITQIWKKQFTVEQIKKRSKERLKVLNAKRIKRNSRTIICKYCSKPVKVRKNEVKVFCNKKCQKSYSRENPIEFSYNKGKTLEDIIGFERSRKVKEKIRKTQQARHPKTELICFRCKSKKVVTIQKKQKILRDLKGKKYFCSNCKAIRKQESKRRAYKCGNCGKTIYRLVSERTTVKFVKRAKKFCDRKCYLEFYKTHPQRYKKQREYAGFVSVQAFRMKENFRYSDIAFSSASERKCAIYLEKEFNLVLKEGITCHVKINTIEVDFLIDKIVIEYHQCYSNPEKLNLSERIRIWRKKGYKFRYEYRTLDEYYKSRKKKLPKDYSLIVIQNTDRSTLRKMKEQIWSYQDNK